MMRIRFAALISAMMFGVLILVAPPASAATNVLLILDGSGSMWERVDGQPKIVTAKRVLRDALGKMPGDALLGFMTYGTHRKGDCGDISLVSPVGTSNAAIISRQINAVTPKGDTPIAAALLKAGDALKGASGNKMIVLVTDGAEECHGNPCDSVKQLESQGLDVQINVVGFNLAQKERNEVQCIAQESHGQYFDAKNTAGLTTAMNEVQTEVAQESAPHGLEQEKDSGNLLGPDLGGQLLAAPNSVWSSTNDGKTDYAYWMYTGQEGVYGFRDGRSARFDTFGIFIDRADASNPKEVELWSGEDGPTGTFNKIGVCKVENTKLVQSPFQSCKFPAITAKFLKVKLLTAQGGGNNVYASEFELLGDLIGSNVQAPASESSIKDAIDLLSADNGGGILAAPNSVWPSTVDGKTDYAYWMYVSQEGVYGFKNGAPATFDTFEMYVDHTDDGNAKEIQLLSGNDSPTGAFTPVASCAFVNTKLTQSPYQLCHFKAVTAKFLKVKLVSAQGGGNNIYASEFRLMGSLSASAAAAPPPAPVQAGRVNLFSPEWGGILTTPNDVWLSTVDGKTDYAYWMYTGQDALFGFKDGRAATFDSFSVYIDHTDDSNPKQIQVWAGDQGLGGQFRPVATCSFQNIKLVLSPFQECRFPPTKAKFVKLQLISAQAGGNNVYATEFQLMGKLEPGPGTPSPRPPAGPHYNLLFPTALKLSPNDVWKATVDGKTDYAYWLHPGEEGVYAFAGGKSASFDNFSVFIGHTDAGNPHEIGLFAGDEAVKGAFRPIAHCTFHNVKVLKSPFQECHFPQVTAKFLKVRLLNAMDNGGSIYATEFQLMGQVK
jgi:hypothetical protein